MNGRYFCFHTGIGYDAAVVQQVERRGSLETLARPPPVHLRGPLRPGSRATTASIRTSASMATAPQRRAARWTTAISRSSSTPTRTPTWATVRSTSPPPPHSTGGSSSSPSARCAHGDPQFTGRRAEGWRSQPRRPPRHPYRRHPLRRRTSDTVPLSGRRRCARRDLTARVRARARRGQAGVSHRTSAGLIRRPSAVEGDVRHIGACPVHAPLG